MRTRLHGAALGFALWTVFIVFETGSQLFLKLGGDSLTATDPGFGWIMAAARSGWVRAAIGCYVATFFLWLLILSRTSLSRAFPMSAVVFIGVLLSSWWVLGERLAAAQWVGIVLILAGVLALGPDED